MDRHIALKLLLETCFEHMDLNTWTGHENKRGFVLTMRFSNKGAILDLDPSGNSVENVVAYKRKTPYQLRRDQVRLNKLNTRQHKRRRTDDESHSYQHDQETLRNNSNSESDLCLSPETVCASEIGNSPGPNLLHFNDAHSSGCTIETISTCVDAPYLPLFSPESDEREYLDSPPVEQPEPIDASDIDIPSTNPSDLQTTESAPASSSNNGPSHDDLLRTRIMQNTHDMLQAYLRLYSVKDPDET